MCLFALVLIFVQLSFVVISARTLFAIKNVKPSKWVMFLELPNGTGRLPRPYAKVMWNL